MILYSPADSLEVPPKGQKDVTPLTKEELQLLLDDRKDSKDYLYYILSVYSGARIGEVLGLSWDDVDLENNIIHIRHSLGLNRVKKVYELGPTKTRKPREVPISSKLLEPMRKHKLQQSIIKLKRGNGYNSKNMIFCNPSGDYAQPNSIRLDFRKAIARIGIEATPHTLRHTFVSQMISAGVDIKIISELVGHANINITYNTYGHLMPNDTTKAIKALENHMQDIVI